jgi:RNA-directed DNA polymerase
MRDGPSEPAIRHRLQTRRKFKRFRQSPKGAREWLAWVIRTKPELFAHWPLLYGKRLDTGSRMN